MANCLHLDIVAEMQTNNIIKTDAIPTLYTDRKQNMDICFT